MRLQGFQESWINSQVLKTFIREHGDSPDMWHPAVHPQQRATGPEPVCEQPTERVSSHLSTTWFSGYRKKKQEKESSCLMFLECAYKDYLIHANSRLRMVNWPQHHMPWWALIMATVLNTLCLYADSAGRTKDATGKCGINRLRDQVRQLLVEQRWHFGCLQDSMEWMDFITSSLIHMATTSLKPKSQ